ncbi:hypothetical protein [Streptomyces sp. NPDC090021]|uniref:hypothetical protein n=1 Tax=Streptomyces sp. NPDC090021 TaxID=3365919 RepID=UPI00381489A6
MPTPKTPPYPRRPELDAANARMRHAFARLGREAARHQGEEKTTVTTALDKLLAEAISTLDRLADEAGRAEDQSPRNQALYARHGARMAQFEARMSSQARGVRG